MRVDIITLLPEIFDNVFKESILGSAIMSGNLDIVIHNHRDYGEGRHRIVDDRPFGGGPGMLMKTSPLINCIRDVRKKSILAPVIGLTPQGQTLNQQLVRDIAKFERIVLVCGRYEGFDERIIPEFDMELSVGDYVMTGGEIAAMNLVDAVARMIPGTVGKEESVIQDSFFDGLLDHVQYTRPANWQNNLVPKVLLDGNHAEIDKFRKGTSLLKTAINRPDIFRLAALNKEDEEILISLIS